MAKLNKDYLDHFFSNDIWLEGRTLYIGANPTHNFSEDTGPDEISAFTAAQVIKGLVILNLKPEEPIKIILNSPGGDIYQGLAIFDAIKRSPCHIEILATGRCMSAASIILQAADKRIMSQNCRLMMHDGEDSIAGHPGDVLAWAKEGQSINEIMYNIYAHRTDKSKAYWAKKCQRDYILTAEQALAEGLIDEIS